MSLSMVVLMRSLCIVSFVKVGSVCTRGTLFEVCFEVRFLLSGIPLSQYRVFG